MRKDSIVVIFLLLVFMPLNSANYYKEGTTWYVKMSPSDPFRKISNNPRVLTIEKAVSDVTGKEYLAMYRIDRPQDKKLLINLMSEGDKVYEYFPETDEKFLIYDFSLRAGESNIIYRAHQQGPVISKRENDLNKYVVTPISDCRKYFGNNIAGEYLVAVNQYPDILSGRWNIDLWIDGIGRWGYPLYNVSDVIVGSGTDEFWVEYEGDVIYRSGDYNLLDIKIINECGCDSCKCEKSKLQKEY